MRAGMLGVLIVLMSMAAQAQTVVGDLTVQGRLRVVTQIGEMVFDGNELSIVSTIDDPPKVRLASPNGGGAVSFNRTRPGSSTQDEIFLVSASEQENLPPGSLGGQLKLFVRRAYEDGDSAMQLAGVISAAYTADGQPVVRFLPILGPFSEPAHPATSAPAPASAPVSSVRVIERGNLRDLQDGWYRAENGNLDTRLVAEAQMRAGERLEVPLRRTADGGTRPYVYLRANGALLLGDQMSSGPYVLTASQDGIIHVELQVSAQTGTIEVGQLRLF